MKNTTFTTEAGAWERISRGKRYRRFAAKEAWNAVTQKINPNRSLENDKKLFSNDRH